VNRTQLKVSALVNGLTLLEAEFANHRYERHFHDELVLAITESGSARINCWGQWFTAGSGDIFVSNPNDPQAAMTLGAPWKYRAFYLARYALDQLAHVLDLESFPRLNCGVFQSAALAEDLLHVHDKIFQPRTEHAVVKKFAELFRAIVQKRQSSVLAKNEKESGRRPPPIQRVSFDTALNYLMQNRTEHCDLDSLSMRVELSRFQLVRLFNQHVGMPPHAFLVQLRLAKACRLLRSGSSIAAAAVDSGFFDQSALTRHFRRSLGVTPRQYQDANRRSSINPQITQITEISVLGCGYSAG
jgi:AraC-like DNA-binding protein